VTVISVTGDDIIVVQSVVARMVADMVAAGIAVGQAMKLVDSDDVGIEVVAMHCRYYLVFQLIPEQQHQQQQQQQQQQ
jgi:hypothetical protein